jgi:hypothetical protein
MGGNTAFDGGFVLGFEESMARKMYTGIRSIVLPLLFSPFRYGRGPISFLFACPVCESLNALCSFGSARDGGKCPKYETKFVNQIGQE